MTKEHWYALGLVAGSQLLIFLYCCLSSLCQRESGAMKAFGIMQRARLYAYRTKATELVNALQMDHPAWGMLGEAEAALERLRSKEGQEADQMSGYMNTHNCKESYKTIVAGIGSSQAVDRVRNSNKMNFNLARLG